MTDIEGMEAGEALQAYELLVTYLKEGSPWVQRWRTYQGEPDDVRAWAPGDAPGVMLLPTFEDQGWGSAQSLRGRLIVPVEIALEMPDLRIAHVYWRALKRVIHPRSRADRNAIQSALAAAAGGSFATGLVEFGGLNTFQNDGQMFLARGRLSLLIHERLEDE
jgi:hypothetical protein